MAAGGITGIALSGRDWNAAQTRLVEFRCKRKSHTQNFIGQHTTHMLREKLSLMYTTMKTAIEQKFGDGQVICFWCRSRGTVPCTM